MPTPGETERAIVLVLLSDERPQRRSRLELAPELRHLPRSEVSRAIVRLDVDGVVERRGEDVFASRATRRLDELGLIAV